MKLKELLFETPASDAHEQAIADKLTDKGFTIWAAPKGSDAGWPDVGASITLPESKKKVHLHIEIKMSKTDPMGSLRKWTFAGKEFESEVTDDNQALILELLNGAAHIKPRAKKMLSLLKKYFHKDVKEIKSGSFSIIKDKKERYEQTMDFVKRAKEEFGGKGMNFQLSNPAIKDPRIGQIILSHYKNKFKAKPGGDNIILFALGSEIFIVPHKKKPTKKVMRELCEVLGVDEIPEIPGSFGGSLEVRVQVRGTSKKGAKPTSLDVMATLRAAGLTKTTKGAHIK